MVDRIKAKAAERWDARVEEGMRQFIESVRHGDITKALLQTDIPKSEVQKFFKNQWLQWHAQIIQESEAYAQRGTQPEPQVTQFPPSNPNNSMTQDQGKSLLAGLMEAKAATLAATETETETGTETSAELSEDVDAYSLGAVEELAEGTLDEYEAFMGDIWSSILDAQMVKDYNAKMAEIQGEVRKLVALVKEGKIGAEYVLLALAKVNVTKNGVLFSWLGKKAYGLNEQMTRASEDLQGMSATDANYTAELTRVQNETRSGSYQLNQVTQEMQKVMQNVSSTLESVHGMIDSINRSRREIIKHYRLS
jgi:hypothetical protein